MYIYTSMPAMSHQRCLLFRLRSITISFLLVLHIHASALNGRPDDIASALQGPADVDASQLEHVDQLSAQTVQATLDSTDPVHTRPVHLPALHSGTQQQQLLNAILNGRFVVAWIRLPARGRERAVGSRARCRAQDAQCRAEVLRRQIRKGQDGQRPREERVVLRWSFDRFGAVDLLRRCVGCGREGVRVGCLTGGCDVVVRRLRLVLLVGSGVGGR